MAAERPERRQLARVGPTSDDALSHPEQLGDITCPEHGVVVGFSDGWGDRGRLRFGPTATDCGRGRDALPECFTKLG
jgi:hypothetical protein